MHYTQSAKTERVVLLAIFNVHVCESLLLSQGQELLPNPFADSEMSIQLPNDLLHWLYERAR